MSIRPQLSLEAPGLSERKSHQTTLGPEKTSAVHANVLRFGFPLQSCGLCAENRPIRMILNAHFARVVPQNQIITCWQNDNKQWSLRWFKGRFLDNNQRDRGYVCLPDPLMVQLTEGQIDAELLTDSDYPNRRMMMGIISCATQPQWGSRLLATLVTHFLIFLSGSHVLVNGSWVIISPQYCGLRWWANKSQFLVGLCLLIVHECGEAARQQNCCHKRFTFLQTLHSIPSQSWISKAKPQRHHALLELVLLQFLFIF